jgi:hypothetical protein
MISKTDSTLFIYSTEYIRVKEYIGEETQATERAFLIRLRCEQHPSFARQVFEVVQSDTYVDKESGKSREIDLVCSHDEPGGIASTRIVVECKSGEKPWIVFSSSHVLEGRNRFFVYADLSHGLRSALLKCEYDLVRKELA